MSDKEKTAEETQPDPKPDLEPQDNKPGQEAPMAGFVIQLEKDGQITRRFFGDQQNVSILYGLLVIAEKEIDALASGMPGQTMSRDTRLLSTLVTSITAMSNVLIGLQSGMNQILQHAEESVNAEPEQKQPDSSREEVPSERS